MILLGACRPVTPTITGKEWVVVAIGDHQAPVGAGGKLLTLILDDSTHQASGFSGCNQYNATYTLTDSSLTFGPVVSTKMFCTEVADVELIYLSSLPYVSHWQVSDSILTLTRTGGMAMKFRPTQR